LGLVGDLASPLFPDLIHQETSVFNTRLASKSKERFPRGKAKRLKSPRGVQLTGGGPPWPNQLPSKVLRKDNFSALSAFHLSQLSALSAL